MSTGLATRFSIQNGRFALTSGSDKAADNLWFLMLFDKLRVYMPQFNPGTDALIQKPTSYLIQYKTIILGRITKLIGRYIPDLKVKQADIIYGFSERKEFALFVDYDYKDPGDGAVTVVFIG